MRRIDTVTGQQDDMDIWKKHGLGIIPQTNNITSLVEALLDQIVRHSTAIRRRHALNLYCATAIAGL